MSVRVFQCEECGLTNGTIKDKLQAMSCFVKGCNGIMKQGGIDGVSAIGKTVDFCDFVGVVVSHYRNHQVVIMSNDGITQEADIADIKLIAHCNYTFKFEGYEVDSKGPSREIVREYKAISENEAVSTLSRDYCVIYIVEVSVI